MPKYFWDMRTWQRPIFILSWMCLLACLLCWTRSGWGEEVVLRQAPCDVVSKSGRAVEVYWREVQAVAERCYGVRFWDNLEVSLGGGYEWREDERSFENEPYGKFKVSLPLYSKTKALDRAEAKRAFLKEASEYIREIEEGRRLTEVLRENIRVKKEILEKVGRTAEEFNSLEKQETRMEEYLKLNERLVSVQAKIRNAERKLEGMIGEWKK